MEKRICKTCGTQYEGSPIECPICLDERQYVGHNGQEWTTLREMKEKRFENEFTKIEPNLVSIQTSPEFAISQRALLIQTEEGNFLWDCVSFIDDKTAEEIDKLGGLDGIYISHPHYYSSMVEWAERFDCEVYVHENDQEWIMRPDKRVRTWSGKELKVTDSITVIQAGGHFDGSAVLHWTGGAAGEGVLLTGDTIYVVPDREWVSFMYSYPNLIPLAESEIETIVDRVEPYHFERIYGAWPNSIVKSNAKQSIKRSAERYLLHSKEKTRS
ncbi:MBL fold metallo-hydrolase [Pseudalkalibacillus caeni]|uniref:MBL fold metallo-hydrolase n=1 Tax=Exobacillus caeni TaxID=2574798 RepID=A0A5R9EYB3_9BACL|nr:MBL fold metallo-hydrolase [Pseudalkalibacillus caeni]TLS36127.1 MBL fold metallo-hydrolase [Pseudalkalibacillus caeni]